MKTYYSVNDSQYVQEFESECDWNIQSEIDQEMMAAECAADHHENHDGWESSWPLVISLHDPATKQVIVRLSVEREFDPTFSAAIINENLGK